MNIETPYLAARDALRASIVTAWSIASNDIHFDAPTTTQTAGDLPQAFLYRGAWATGSDSMAKGARDAVHPIPFQIEGRFALPASGNVDTASMAKVQALLTLLTASYPRYAGWKYGAIEFGDVEVNPEERFYTVPLSIVLEILTSA